MPAEKNSKKKTVKKSAGAGSSKKAGSPVKNGKSGGNNSAFYVLIIVILVTIIVLMLNRFYDKGSFKLPDFRKMLPAAGEVKEKKIEPVKEKSSEQPEKESRQEIKEPVKEAEKDKVNEKIKEEKPAVLQKEVAIYLLKLDEKTERIYLSTVKRTVADKDILATALENLIKGPTQKEKDRGYISAVPAGLKVRGISINGKTAEIDFNSVIEEGAAGDILLKRVQQIVYTSTQFDNVESIIIKINGQRRKSMGSDGFSISGPLKR